MRRRNVRRAHERVLKYDNLILHPTDKLNVDELFDVKRPVYLEIGMGKGNFIIEHARRNPNINYIGFEKYESVILQALVKLEEYDLPNLKLVCADATNLLELFEKESRASNEKKGSLASPRMIQFTKEKSLKSLHP